MIVKTQIIRFEVLAQISQGQTNQVIAPCRNKQGYDNAILNVIHISLSKHNKSIDDSKG